MWFNRFKKWRTKSGEYIRICDMETQHLEHAILLLEGVQGTTVEMAYEAGFDGGGNDFDYCTYYVKVPQHPLFEAMIEELQRRRRKSIKRDFSPVNT